MRQVKTHSECDVCHARDTRIGAEGETPPVGWSQLRMSKRAEGAGWTNSSAMEAELCPECASKIEMFVRKGYEI